MQAGARREAGYAAWAPQGVGGLRHAGRATPRAGGAARAVSSASRLCGAPLRPEYPILEERGADGAGPLVYFDNAATSQKPAQVRQAMEEYYLRCNSNVHRGVHTLSARATEAYETARAQVAAFVGAADPAEVVFTRNASEAINLVAHTWGEANIGRGDEIVLSVAEHHSNIVPWQMLAARKGAVLRFIELTPSEELDLQQLEDLVGPRTKLVSLAHVSNTLGAVLDVDRVVRAAKTVDAKVLLDSCQSVPHMAVDVQALGVDWIVASSHKMCGPTGVGFLWGKMEVLENMPPWMGGGEMIQDVFLDHSTYAPPPLRFEAGTPAICEAIGMGAACEYLTQLGMDAVHQYENEIGAYLYKQLAAIDGVHIYGPPPSCSRGRASLAAFNVDGLHATDISMVLDTKGVAIRSGHHCTQPLHRHLGINASARASLYIYNTKDEVDRFITALQESIEFFKM